MSRLLEAGGENRPKPSQATFSSYCRLDQPASQGRKNSLNLHAVCLIVVDTHRHAIRQGLIQP